MDLSGKKSNELDESKNNHPKTERELLIEKYMKEHADEVEENYIKGKTRNIDVDINAIVVQRQQKLLYEKKMKELKEKERLKWERLQKKQEEKKKKKDNKGYRKYINENPNKIRILMLGESQSGKTSIINRYTYNKYSEDYAITRETKLIRPVNQTYKDKIFHIEIVDTPPLEDYLDKVDEELAKANVVIFVYDVSSKGSLQRIKEIILDFDFFEDQKWGIIATKKDLAPEYKKYRAHELKNFCYQFGMSCALVSVKKNNNGINKYFERLFPTILPILY